MKSLHEGMFANQNYSRTGYGGQVPIGPILGPIAAPGNQAIGQNLSTSPIEVDYCGNLRGWQQQLVGMLIRNQNSDVYILSQPGSGKTLPIICYWVNTILEISTNGPSNNSNLMRLISSPETIPQVLWLVPIKNLSANIEQEMVERFTSIILQILNRSCFIDPISGDIIFNNPELPIPTILDSLGKNGGRQSEALVLSMMQRDIVPSNRVSEFKTALGQLIQNYVSKNLVGRIEDGINTVEIGSGQYKPFIISIYESSIHTVKNMNNLKMIVFDEAQRIQGGDKDTDTRAAQIGISIHKILFDNNGRKARIIMLSGSTSPKTAQNVMHYFNMTYDRKFEAEPYQTPTNVTNPANIRVHGISNLNDEYNQLRIIKTDLANGKDGIVFIVFSKARINSLIDKLAPNEKGIINPGRNLAPSRGSLYNVKSDIGQITSPGEINSITDDRLRRAASNGIGYLYRPEELTPARQHDTTIIQNLFRAGIVRVIFATDAVREGINITCKEMYLPTIINPSSQEEMRLDSLTQLVNRAGRKENQYATIYTDPKFIRHVNLAFSTDPKRFGEEPFILPGSISKAEGFKKIGAAYTKIEAGLNYGLNLPVEAAKDLGTAFIQAFRKP